MFNQNIFVHYVIFTFLVITKRVILLQRKREMYQILIQQLNFQIVQIQNLKIRLIKKKF